MLEARHYIDEKLIGYMRRGYKFTIVGVEEMLDEIEVEVRRFHAAELYLESIIKRRLTELAESEGLMSLDAGAYLLMGLVRRTAFDRPAPKDNARPKRMITL